MVSVGGGMLYGSDLTRICGLKVDVELVVVVDV